jgi:hypothetical protein
MKSSAMTLLPILILIMLGEPMLAQTSELLSNYFGAFKAGKSTSAPPEFSAAEHSYAILREMDPYLTDSNGTVRAKAYEVSQLTATASADPSTRSKGIHVLLKGCKDKRVENSGLAMELLTTFTFDDFTPSDKDTIRALVKTSTHHLDKIIKLAGFLQLIDLKDDIRPYRQPGSTGRLRWAAILSLARMGETYAIEEVMKRVTRLPINDEVVYSLFPDLIYTRQRIPVAYVVQALQSGDENCMSADAEKERPIMCGYRIMEQLAPVVEGYPLALDESGDIKTDDYTLALELARHWLGQNENYRMITNTF